MVKTIKSDLKKLYEQDFYLWLEANAKLLTEKRFTELDLEHLIVEINSMGKSEKRELENRLIVLIMHLLKCQYQPEKLSQSWISTIKEQRRQIRKLLKNSPSLKSYLPQIMDESYQDARFEASDETKLELVTFPVNNPFSLDDILKSEFFPNI